MPLSKRIFDIVFSIFLITVLSPIFICIIIALYKFEGRPILYVSERMRDINSSFKLLKFRTMKEDPENTGVTGGDKSSRSSNIHLFLRKTRLDELPQLFNVLRGDMTFVGPRPPLRQYVNDNRELYGRVLKCRPGVTGLASLKFHRHEEILLMRCNTAEETDIVYRRRCIPRKATLDLLYAENWSLCLDVKLILATAIKPFKS